MWQGLVQYGQALTARAVAPLFGLSVLVALGALGAAVAVMLGAMEPGLPLTALTLAGIVMTAAFGILGKIVKLQDDTGRFLPWGALALFGSVAGLAIAVATFGVQYTAQARASAQRQIEAERLLTRVLQGATRIEGAQVEFGFRVDAFQYLYDANRVAKQADRTLIYEGGGAMTGYATSCLDGWPAFGSGPDNPVARALDRPVLAFAIVGPELAGKIVSALKSRSPGPSYDPVADLLGLLEGQMRADAAADPVLAQVDPRRTDDFLAGQVVIGTESADCTLPPVNHPVSVRMGSDDVLRVRSPFVASHRLVSSGGVIGRTDLGDKVLIVVSSVLAPALVGDQFAFSSLSINLPPNGHWCFDHDKSGGLVAEVMPSGFGVAVARFDKVSPRIASYC